MLEKSVLKKEMENAINWIKEYVEKAGANGVVIGNSGGKDSATVLAMAVKALGKDKVISVAMPCLSKTNDLEDAKLVADTFDVKLMTVDLTKSYKELEKETNRELKEQLNLQLINESTVNIKPRLRMTTLYAIAQTLGYLVIGTGNLCESMVRLYYEMGR